ncbi:DUF1900-domain-containing protein [Ramicandelaber brevisporus]|nr:DUF1900-domain-containing protein [Ramicandelaber brevisporus]
MNRFVRSSKFRHVFGTAAKRDQCYENLRSSTISWDTNLASVNQRYIAVNWSAGGGGSFAVLPLSAVGKVPGDMPLYAGHSAPVLDIAFSPFNDSLIASAAEDAKLLLWSIDSGDQLPEENVTEPVASLKGHGRKVGHAVWHPSADHVLASSSHDLTVRLWDVEKATERQCIPSNVHGDLIQSLAWNYDGSLLVTTCRDKNIRLIDPRANSVVSTVKGHTGLKGSRVVWLGDKERFVTTGFDRSSDRQVFLWDPRNLQNDRPLRETTLDTSPGTLMPFFDNDTRMLYLAGKGDATIRYFELENDELFSLSEYRDSELQRGMAWMPKRALNINDNEIARFFKVTASGLVVPISFTVPRRSDAFQADLYPPTLSDEPALTADEYFAGKTSAPKLTELGEGFVSQSKERTLVIKESSENLSTPVAQARSFHSTTPSPSATPAPVSASPAVSQADKDLITKLQKQNVDLSDSLSDARNQIKSLNVELHETRTASDALATRIEGEVNAVNAKYAALLKEHEALKQAAGKLLNIADEITAGETSTQVNI